MVTNNHIKLICITQRCGKNSPATGFTNEISRNCAKKESLGSAGLA